VVKETQVVKETVVVEPTEPPPAEGFTPDIEGALSHTSGKRFDGVVLKLTGSGTQIDFVATAAKEWEKATGASVELVTFGGLGELGDKVLTALTAGTYIGDLINMAPYLAGDLMGGGYIEPMPAEVKARLDWDDVLPVFRNNQTDWGGVTYGYPWDGDVHSMYYNKEIFENPDNKARFKAEYGYELAAPRTWDEFKDQAVFFTGDWGDGKQHYGAAMLLMRGNHGFHGFTSVAACHAKMPDDPAFYFDPDTMEPRINTPGFVRALQYVKDLMPYMPPGVENMGWADNANAFVGGLAALDIQWADIGPISNDPERSLLRGKVGYGMTPGCRETYDARSGEWVRFADVNYAPYAAYGGWQNLVPVNAASKEAAIDLAAYLASPQVLLWASVTPGSGVNPARQSILDAKDAWLQAGFPTEEDVEAYVEAQERVMAHPNSIFQLRLPGYNQYQDSLELAVSKALAGQLSPQEALDEAAAEWNRITDRMGRDKQKSLYRGSVGLSD
jgi:multiple sugar transport system substrate-binding protein